MTLEEENILKEHTKALNQHSRALAAHCECMAMNAENCARACLNQAIAYHDSSYYYTMRRWGLINENDETLIK